MAKKSLWLVFLLVTILIGASLASASTEQTLWQIGYPDGSVNPIQGSAEYPVNEAFYPEFNYPVGSDTDPINAPTIPGLIGPANVCDFVSDGRPCTDTTAELNINFDLACNYEAAELTFTYARYGSESDTLSFDGNFVDTITGPGEGNYQTVSYPFAAGAGSHTITIAYAGGGSGNGHYIDYLALNSSFQCVAIDIKPGSDPSCFNNDGHGVIPVAILGSAELDVMQIDPSTVYLDGLNVAAKGKKSDSYMAAYEDVNGDGFVDLVVKIEDQDGVFTQGSGTAEVTGSLFDGTLIKGTGDICITQ